MRDFFGKLCVVAFPIETNYVKCNTLKLKKNSFLLVDIFVKTLGYYITCYNNVKENSDYIIVI